MATIDSLVERHTFAIDRSSIETGDKYRYHGEFYSDKPAMLAIVGAGVAFALKIATGISLTRRPQLAYYLITLLVVGTSYAVGLAVLYRTLRSMSVKTAWAICVTTTAGVGTLLLPYATIFNNHVVSGALIVIGFNLARRPPARQAYFVAAGAAFALASSIDIAFAIFFVLAPMLFAKHGLTRTFLPFLASAAPFISAYFVLNVLLSGSLIPPAMNAPLWAYPGSAFNQSNLSGLAVHRPIGQIAFYGFNMLFGNYGLFSYMPILLLSLYGFWRGFRTNPAHRNGLAYIIACCVIYVAMYVLTTDNYSGQSYGVRWYAGIVYLAIIPLAFIGDEIAQSPWLRGVFAATTFASIAVAVLGLVNLSPEHGMSPVLANAHQELVGRQHVLKIGLQLLFILGTTLLLVRLAGFTQRKSAASVVRASS